MENVFQQHHVSFFLAYCKRRYSIIETFLISFLKLEHKYFGKTMEKLLFVKGVGKGKLRLRTVAASGTWRRGE